MKTAQSSSSCLFVLACLNSAIQVAEAATSRVDGFIGLVSTGTQTAATKTQLLLDYSQTTPTDHPIWEIETMSYYDHDTGYEWIRVTHYLNEYVAADDTVTFSLNFQSSTDDWVDPKNVMIEDVGECVMTISSADTRFWDQTPKDKYVKCAEQNCANAAITTASGWMTGTFTTSADSQEDWYCEVVDDDEEAPFCTPLATTDTYYDAGLYSCSAMKCIHQRMKETWDMNDQDFMFDASLDTGTMILGMRRPSITISKATDTTTYPVPAVLAADISITIYKSALTLSAIGLSTATALAALSIF